MDQRVEIVIRCGPLVAHTVAAHTSQISGQG